MPAVANESMDEALGRFEAALREHAPDTLQHLQPGLSAERIADLERAGGIQLPDDLRALYRWRNGVPAGDYSDIIPLHRFQSLEELLERRNAAAKSREDSTSVQGAVFDALVGHTLAWIPIFVDPAGDGYFYDPTRRPEQGAVLYNFLEVNSFQFYPSLKNLLVGLAECYEKEAYTVTAEGRLDRDTVKAIEILREYGVDFPTKSGRWLGLVVDKWSGCAAVDFGFGGDEAPLPQAPSTLFSVPAVVDGLGRLVVQS